ncbi:MAG: hypothetical protein CVU60_04895 [Deltaproteobacteria bacterium HGW-Deltaproteobacteria-18]|nr:MAG: hypothetical protein CVU60_04895 [Deltaproteobacteria bacterium HGW-Deltaproteobacteria-18]
MALLQDFTFGRSKYTSTKKFPPGLLATWMMSSTRDYDIVQGMEDRARKPRQRCIMSMSLRLYVAISRKLSDLKKRLMQQVVFRV